MSGLNVNQSPESRESLHLAEEAKQGNLRAIARLISLLENQDQAGISTLHSLNGTGRQVTVIGITGYPGAGKSTLIDQLVRIYRRQGKKVGIIAIDPSSPKTGGALLGDRIRMHDHARDPNVFIRSMATRGYHGGLARTTGETVAALRATGFQVILLETVGVGQGEVDVAELADMVVTVVTPGLGDEVQALKAGLLEIADIVVVNKRDLPGADAAVKYLQEWVGHVIPTNAITGEGVEEVAAAIAELERTARPTSATEMK